MINLEKYFDKIVCINLDRRPDRYERFKSEMEKFNIKNVQRFSAVDGNTITETNTALLKGEVGILLSHLNIIKNAKKEGLKNILIMEDDVFFTDEIKNIDDYLQKVPNDWDFIYFGGNHVYGPKPTPINDKVLKLNYTVALQCVAINHTMFEIIEAILPNMKKQVDGYYAELHDRFNAYGFYPNMAKQIYDFSDIQNKYVNYTNFFIDEK